jgi:hypothetical protein
VRSELLTQRPPEGGDALSISPISPETLTLSERPPEGGNVKDIPPVSPETLPHGLWDNGLPPKGGGAVRTPGCPKDAFKVVLSLKDP